MKWFQLDADTPSDPRIRAVIARFGNAGLGALMRLWCFIADHGNRPGVSIDSHGKPFKKATLVEATGLTARTYRDLMRELAENGHIEKTPFLKSGLIVIPAMSKRASNYEKYQRRRNDDDSSSKRRKQDSTYKDSTYNARGRAGELRSPSSSRFEKNGKKAPGSRCPHTPQCQTIHACIERTVDAARKERGW